METPCNRRGGASPKGVQSRKENTGASGFSGIAQNFSREHLLPCFSFIPRTDCTMRGQESRSLTARRRTLVTRSRNRLFWGQEGSSGAGAPAPRQASRLSQPKVPGTLRTAAGDSSHAVNKPA